MSASQSRIFEGLNPPQREAVETLEGPLLILAGAGSGKTRVVTRRVVNLIAHGARPWEILAITFTNKAAAEMRRRVEELAERPGTRLSTFHSFCAWLLRREAEIIGYTRDFTIYDEEDALGVLKDIVKRLGLAEDKRWSARSVRQTISNLKNQGTTSADLDEALFQERVLKQIFQEYEAELKKSQALDFDDLLMRTVLLFKDHVDVLERYQQRFRYVLVDEYQDTNKCQYLLVQMLGAKHRNVCATGDPDQSIYAWRGADVRNILSFERDFPEAKVVKLEQNYRSTQNILSAASAVIDHNIERKKKTLWTENAAGERVGFTAAADEQMEAYEVARQIEAQVRTGRSHNDIAIFYRTNAQSRPLEEVLRQHNIPHVIVGGITFYERREVKDSLAYLRLIVNPKDDVSFRRVINMPRRGLGDSALDLIEQQADKLGCSRLDTLDGPIGEQFIGTFKPKPRQGLIQFARLIESLRVLPPFPVEKIVKTMLEKSGLRALLVDEDELDRVENVEELVNAAAVFDKEHDPAKQPATPPPEPGAYDDLNPELPSLSGFLERVALMAPTDNYDPEKDYVTLMTLHMAKGLEFPVVFLTGMEEGLLPLLRGSEGEEDKRAIEEERRLVYVGMTRAKEKLYVSRAMRRRRYGQADLAAPSRFLDEIPEKLLDVSDRSQPSWMESAGFSTSSFDKPRGKKDDEDDFAAFEREVDKVFGEPAARQSEDAVAAASGPRLDLTDTQESAPPFEVGDRVRHADFGEGIIERISGQGDSLKVKIHFRDRGPKQLLLCYALAKMKRV